MSKAIMSVAVLGASVVAGAFSLGLGGVALEAAFNTVVGVDAIFGGLALGASMGAGAIADALTSNRGMDITTRQTAACRQIVYGQQRVGGVYIYKSTTGSSHDQFNYVIVIAGHVVDSLQNLYLDGRQVHWLGSGAGYSVRNGVGFGGVADNNTYAGPNGVHYNFGGTGHSGIYCEARYGDQSPGDVIGALTANDPNWAADGLGDSPWVAGCTYIYLKIEYNTNLFPGEPEIRITVNGKNNIFDPRTGTSGFTSNWALVCADVLTDSQFGLNDNTVNQAQLIAAANVCDEMVALAVAPGTLEEFRYTVNTHYDTSTSPMASLTNMMAVSEGQLSRVGGEWYLWPAYFSGASATFGPGDFTADIQWKGYRDTRDLFNVVNGTYTAPTFPFNIAGNLYDQNGFYNGMAQNNTPFAWKTTNAPAYASDPLHGFASDQYFNEDGMVVLPEELDLPGCISHTQWQRVAKIHLMRNRQQGSGTFEMSLAAFNMMPKDVMEVTFPAMGWSSKLFEVTGMQLKIVEMPDGTPSIRVGVNVIETSPSVYDWTASAEELTVYDQPASPTQTTYDPAPPTNMVLTSGAVTAVINADGTIQPRVKVSWDTPLDILVKRIEIQYSPSGLSQWTASSFVDVGLNESFISGVVAGSMYDIRIRSVRGYGAAVSAWEEIDGYTVSITLSITGSLAVAPEGTLIGEAPSAGVADIVVEPFTPTVGPAVSCLPAGAFTITGLSQSVLYWVYYIDPTFAGGAITPIATTNTSDFLGKVGYFLIGSIVTPFFGSGGGLLYAPTSYVDSGTRTTSNPTAAYDNDLTTQATVSSRATSLTAVDGVISYGGFSGVLPSSKTLNIIASVSMSGASSHTATIDMVIGGSTTNVLTLSTSAASATYSLSVPSGTNLSSLSILCQTVAAMPGGGVTSILLNIFDISIS